MLATLVSAPSVQSTLPGHYACRSCSVHQLCGAWKAQDRKLQECSMTQLRLGSDAGGTGRLC